ncbi:MAG: (2Fe-2S)-binding protein [Candidatus Auribacterota bacterium]|nr:(2Fe-2S)-binding protein [Candidatus Auribacterota bacterium]
MKIQLTVNGEKKSIEANPSETLLELLRRIGYKSVKFGCGEGFCGACTVILDGRPVNSCLILAATVEGKEVVTVEDMGDSRNLHPLQTAFMDAGAIQCGFCTPGMLLSAKVLLERKANPTTADIKEALEGNLCRCTGYIQIIEAVKLAAKRMRKVGSGE